MGVAAGATYNGGDAALLERMLPHVRYIEVTPDTIARRVHGRSEIRPEVLDELREIAKTHRILAHGVGLSIESHDGWCDDYLSLLDQLFAAVDIPWHSEHLGYTRVDGRPLGTMLVMPRVEEVVSMVCRRVEAMQQRYPVPFLLENVVNVLPEHPAEDYSPARFLNEITRRTGCGLVLDVYNLECDARNQRLDLVRFFGELDFAAVREVHIANGVEHRGLLLDVHSRRTRPETLDLADEVLRRAPNVEVVVYEFLPQAIEPLGRDAIVDELAALARRVA